jgi:NRPS condensation-like uncharacterized protein
LRNQAACQEKTESNIEEKTMSQEFKMELTFERSFLPTRSSNIKIAAYLNGEIDEKIFRDALSKLAGKHPYLRSKIVMREDGTAYLTTQGGKEPHAVVVEGSSEADIFDAIYQQDQHPSHWENDPTSRFLLIKGIEGLDVIVAYIQHVVADGRAAALVLKHLLEFIANPEKEINELMPISMIENAPGDVEIPEAQRSFAEQINAGWAAGKVTFNGEDFLDVARKKYAAGPDIYVDQSLTSEETFALRNKSRAEGVSVNAALLAGILTAKHQVGAESLPDNLGFAVDVRERLTREAGEACNLLASGAMVAQEYDEGITFWELAQDIHDQTIQAVASNQNLFGSRLLSQIMDPTFNDAMYMFQQGGWEGTPLIQKMGSQGSPVGAVLTNLGGLQLPGKYPGPHPLELVDAVFYPPIGVEKVIEMGASSLRSRLHLVTVSPRKAANRELKENILPAVIEILRTNL